MKKKAPKKTALKQSPGNVKKAPMTPLGDRILVKPLSSEEMGKVSASGIIIPDTAGKEKPAQGTVVAVGPGRFNEDGDARIPLGVSVGDRIVFSKYGYEEVKLEGVEFYLVSESSVLAIIN